MIKVKEKKLNNTQTKESQKHIKYLYKHRDMLIKTRIDLDNSFDKYLLTFATGTLYLSILFTKTLDEPFKQDCLLLFGWIALVASICMTLLSILWSIKSYEVEEENIAKVIEYEEDGREAPNCKNHWGSQINFTETVGVVGFIMGLVLLAFFYLINIV